MPEPWGLKSLFFLIIVLGFCSLFLLPGISALALFFIMFLLVPGWFVPKSSELPPSYKISWSVALLIFFLISFLESFYTAHPLYLTLAYQLGFIQLYKVFNRKGAGDYVFAWLVAFAMLILAILVSHSIALSIIILPFIVFSAALFTVGSIGKERAIAEQTRPTRQKTKAISPPKSQPRLAWQLSILGGASLLLSWLIFLSLPGLGLYPAGLSPFAMTESNATKCLSNFTTSVNLGAMRQLLSDSTPVLRIKLSPARDVKQLYLRGATLNYFTGRSWEKSARARIPAQQVFPAVKGPTVINRELYQAQAGNLLKQHLTFVDSPLPYILGVPEVIAVEGIRNNIYRDLADTLNLLQCYDIRQYTVYSLPYYTAGMAIKEQVQEDYLQIPEHHSSKEMEQLARELTQHWSDDYQRARAIEQYFHEHYSYSLSSAKSVENFLFEKKTGYCEYFATAMVLLLRHVGIPSRLAVGFYVDASQDNNAEFLVRRQDAHTWVEAWIAGQGWEQFDPTPPSPFPVYGRRLMFKKLYDMALGLRNQWEKLINLPGGKFSPLLLQLASLLNKGIEEIASIFTGFPYMWRELRQSIFKLPMLVVAIAILIIDIVLIWLYYRWRNYLLNFRLLQRRGQASNWQIANLYYQILRRIGARRRQRPSFLTAREFALSAYHGTRRDKLEQLLTIYYSIRFGERPFSAALRASSIKLLQEL